jgi:ATP-dependent RNA helicase DeaD
MGFLEEVEKILAETPESKQVALFSATMPPPIKRIAQRYLKQPVEISVKNKTATAANIRQRMLYVQWQQKMDAMTRLLEVEDFEAMIIFVRTKSATEDVAERLRSRGFAAAAINGDLNQAQRERVINDLRNGKLDLLVATDVAARGLDVERISHVLNYDIPTDTESYVHRVGRTGRAGRSGEAILFVTPREKGMLAAIEKATKQPIEEMALPTVTQVNQQRVAKFHHAITEALSLPNQQLFKELVVEYARDRDVALADIAGALAAMHREEEAFLLSDEPAPPPRKVERPKHDDHKTEGTRREKRAGNAKDLVAYRLGAGKRNNVTPAQVVAALIKEGGLTRSDIGNIGIKQSHTIVELPAHLSKKTLQAMAKTKVAGRPAALQRDTHG